MENLSRLLEIYNKVNQFGAFMAMDFEIIKPGEVKYQLKVKKELLATPTKIHGGAIAGFMDAVIGVAALSAVANQNMAVSTVEFKINYLKPAFLNDQLLGIGKVVQQGKRIIVSEGKIMNQNNEVIAIALGTFNAYPIEKSDFNDVK